jgi:hypothetical protein
MMSADAGRVWILPNAMQHSPNPFCVPDAAWQYIMHITTGISMRALARAHGQAPSTICRRVRALETRRDDPLLDEALTALAQYKGAEFFNPSSIQEPPRMTFPFRSPKPDDAFVIREARRILRRLCEPSAILVVADDMNKAIVLRQHPDGEQTRTAVVDRDIAQAFCLNEWIACKTNGKRVAKYVITATGKTALRRLIDQDRKTRRKTTDNRTDAHSSFQGQHITWGTRTISDDAGGRKKMRVNLAESPLVALSRRKGADGQPFLTADLVQVGERLREDFERAQMGPRIGQNWDRFLTGHERGQFPQGDGPAAGPSQARKRVAGALEHLGPGLGDVVLRVCCFLEGLESAEKRLGWSARSGKVVLKIGLQRLLQHYQDEYGFAPALRR